MCVDSEESGDYADPFSSFSASSFTDTTEGRSPRRIRGEGSYSYSAKRHIHTPDYNMLHSELAILSAISTAFTFEVFAVLSEV